MSHFRVPSFIISWLEHMFDTISARQIVRERYFKRRENEKQRPQTDSSSRDKTTEKKDTIRPIRKIRIPAAVN